MRPSPPLVRWSYALIAYACAGLALAGILLPGLPTVPFLLIAAWASTRGSERLRRWLYDHRRLGPLLLDWEAEGAVNTRAKWAAVVLLMASWMMMFWHSDGTTIPLVTAILFLSIAAYVVTRPTPNRTEQAPVRE